MQVNGQNKAESQAKAVVGFFQKVNTDDNLLIVSLWHSDLASLGLGIINTLIFKG